MDLPRSRIEQAVELGIEYDCLYALWYKEIGLASVTKLG